MAEATFDAFFLIDDGQGFVIEIQLVPVGNIANGFAAEIVQRAKSFIIHPVAQPIDHIVDDSEAEAHRCRANLHAAATQCNVFSRIAPGADTADARDGQPAGFRVAGNFRHHAQGDGFYRWSAVASMRSFSGH